MGDLPARNVCAVVVTQEPELQLLGRVLHETWRQVGRIVVVDNGSSASIAGTMARGCGETVEFLQLDDNYGVGAAHNAGIQFAREHGFEYVLILDQDSIPQPGMVLRLMQAMERLKGAGAPVCAVGPRYVDPVTQYESYFVRLNGWRFERAYCDGTRADAVVAADFLISSGSLIPIAVLDEIGGMDEGLFIDHVDTDWYFRAKARGYAAFGVCDAVMQHSLGSRAIRVRGLREHQVAIRSPLRLYYMVRNSLSLYRRPHVPLGMRLADGRRVLSLCLFFGMLVPPRLQYLRMMAKGAWHGMRGVSGRYSGT